MKSQHVKEVTAISLRKLILLGIRYPVSRAAVLRSCILLLASCLFLSCHTPFQPEVQYSPKLNVYSVLFANTDEAYVRLTAVVSSQSSALGQAVHGATVTLQGPGGSSVRLSDTTEVIEGNTTSFYHAPIRIIPGENYTITATKQGYPVATASAKVPFGYATIPDQNAYSGMQHANGLKGPIDLNVTLSDYASAVFVQAYLEYRGLDNKGNLRIGDTNIMPVDSLNPFTEITSGSMSVSIDTTEYKNAFKEAKQRADSLTIYHMFVCIVVTQVDNNLYRFFVTSLRSVSPLQMRTDKIIFSNVFGGEGTGIVAGASVDTTRVFLF